MNPSLRSQAAAVGIACALAAFTLLPMLLSGYLLFQVSLALTYAMAILGLNLLLGFGGQVCLAQGAFFACGGYTTAILASNYGIDPLLTLPAAALVTGLVGVAIGLPALRLPGLQLAVVTFGIAAVVPQLLLKLEGITGGVMGIGIDPPEPPAWFPGDQEQWLYALCAAGACLCAVVMAKLVRGDSGRTLHALRNGPLIAESLGVDLTRARLTVFAISSAFAGLGGGLYALLNAYISPQSFLAARSIDILVGSIIGGAASVTGAFVGAVFVLFVPDWASGINPALGGLIYGLCLIGMMLVARDGLVGLAAKGLKHLPTAFGSKPTQQPPASSPALGGRRP
jgi:branched-chain amino acid transport system permease protein